jgi:cobalt-zinc-cadmium efflux system outer membrane protein
MKRKEIIILLAVPVMLAGCIAFHSRPISPSETASSFEARTLDDPGLKKFIESKLRHQVAPWPPKSWDITMLTLASFYYNAELEVARAKWGVAKAGVITAGARPNPSVSFIPQYASNSTGGISPWVLNLSFDIPVETVGKRGYRIARAEHLSEAAHLHIATVAWQVRGRLRRGLLDLYVALQKETILRSRLALQEEILKLLERRLSYGEISSPELLNARLDRDRIHLSLADTGKQITGDRAAVAGALGLPLKTLSSFTISFDFLNKLPEGLPPEDIRRQALLNRSDILSALSTYEAAQSELQLEIAKQYPDIHLGPGYEFDQGENKWAFGFAISLPVLNRNEGPIAEAEARRKEKSAQFDALQARIIGQTEMLVAAYSDAIGRLKTAESLVSSQKEKERSAEAMFSSGETDRLAPLSTRIELTSADLSRLSAFYYAQETLGLIEDEMERPLYPSGIVRTESALNPNIEKEKQQ